jgi:hypothetical protein
MTAWRAGQYVRVCKSDPFCKKDHGAGLGPVVSAGATHYLPSMRPKALETVFALAPATTAMSRTEADKLSSPLRACSLL